MRIPKIILCFLCLIYPILIGIFVGTEKGLSLLSGTEYEPLFIFINACTSFFFFSYKRITLKVMSVCLLLLTCFSTHLFPVLHNFFAVLFFLVAVYELKNWKIFLLSLLFLVFGNIFFFESFLIAILAVHNLKLLRLF